MQVNRSKEAELSAEHLRELLTYDPETGVLRWRFSRPKARAGDVAGDTCHKRGYRNICVDYRKYLAHRLVWLYVYGVWPEGEIDHIDGNTDNNSLGNLRAATRQQNNWNRSVARQGSELGLHNIGRRGNSFRVRITNGRTPIYSRQFKSLEKAIAMRDQQLAAFRGKFSPEIREGS